MGATLRLAFVEELRWLDYRYMMHAHSHVAMLGWIYLAIYALLIHCFLPKAKQQSGFYGKLFWFTELTVIGMAVAFPLQGYAGVSIFFSGLHIVASYLFMWRFLKDLQPEDRGNNSIRFVRAALWFMVLSSLAIWCMPILTVNDLAGSAVYYAAVQFYLHFQFNGWVILAILALFFRLIEFHQLAVAEKNTNRFYYLMIFSCILTYVLAVTWSTPLAVLFYINSTGVALQLAALIYFVFIYQEVRTFLSQYFSGWVRYLFLLALISFLLKILVQSAVIVPQIGVVAYTIRNFVLGFIHLLLLGMATCFLLGFAANERIVLLKGGLAKVGLFFLLIGIVLSELILFGQGVLLWSQMGFMPNYYLLIFGVSVLMPIGILLLICSQYFFFSQRIKMKIKRCISVN
ncbi:MAG: hypothetical protein AAFZ15_14245 [Bacteroidota bacterium]